MRTINLLMAVDSGRVYGLDFVQMFQNRDFVHLKKLNRVEPDATQAPCPRSLVAGLLLGVLTCAAILRHQGCDREPEFNVTGGRKGEVHVLVWTRCHIPWATYELACPINGSTCACS